MTQQERADKDITEQYLKGVNLRLIWALIVCTAVSVATVLTVYHGMKTEVEIMKLRMTIFDHRIELLENKKERERE